MKILDLGKIKQKGYQVDYDYTKTKHISFDGSTYSQAAGRKVGTFLETKERQDKHVPLVHTPILMTSKTTYILLFILQNLNM